MQGAEGRFPETDTTLQGWPTGWALCSSMSGGSRVSQSLAGSSLNSISDTIGGSAIPSDSESPSSSPSPTSLRPCPDPLLLASFWTALVFHCDLPHEWPHLNPVFP